MPNRIIKESAFTSEKVAALSDFEFRVWVGLITQADDAGRGDARPAIIKGRVFALRERVSVKDIEMALRNLAAGGCVSLYHVGGKPYYQFPNWANHQRVRDAKPKYPGINESDNSPQLAATRGDSPQLAALIQSNPIRIQSESESESNAGARACAAFCETVGSMPSPSATAEILTLCDKLTEDVVISAFDTARDNGKRGWAYVRAILRRYEQEGVDSMDKVRAQMGKKPVRKKEQAAPTADGLAEMKRMLEEM